MDVFFDFLLGLFAVGNAAIEVATMKAAKNGGSNSQTSFVAPEKPCFEEEQVKEKKTGYSIGHYVSAVEAKNEYNRRLQQRKMQEAQEQEKKNPLEKWVFSHDKLILEIIKNPGTHIISNDDLGNVPVDDLIDLLFASKNVESVETVPEGIEIITR